MAWQLTEDLETFLTAAGGFLRARPAANTVILTAAEHLRAKGATAYGGVTPLFGCRAGSDGAVTAAFLHTPPFPVVLTDMTDAAAAELAGVAGRAQPDRGRAGPDRPGLHAAGPARPRFRRRGHGGDHPGRPGRRRRGRGAVHRSGQPH